MFDPHPDSIVSLLSRRDVKTQSEQIKIMIDSYHDRSTGYEFAVNPAGVKRDYYTYDDSREDITWDAVWDVATTIDSLGWTAEFRIPLSQIRYPKAAEHTFGLMILRDVARTSERDSWPLLRRSVRASSSQFGELERPRAVSALRTGWRSRPTSSQRTSAFRSPTGSAVRRSRRSAVISSTASRRISRSTRPSIQTSGRSKRIRRSSISRRSRRSSPSSGRSSSRAPASSASTAMHRGLFYSRRIGRAPQLAGLVSDPTADIPATTPILGAGKLTGRLATGHIGRHSVRASPAVSQSDRR